MKQGQERRRENASFIRVQLYGTGPTVRSCPDRKLILENLI